MVRDGDQMDLQKKEDNVGVFKERYDHKGARTRHKKYWETEDIASLPNGKNVNHSQER